MEGYREGVRVEAPKGPLGQAPVNGKCNGGSADFLRDAKVGNVVKLGPPQEEEEHSEREEGGPRLP